MRCEIDVVVAKEVSETNLRVKDPSYIVTPKNFFTRGGASTKMRFHVLGVRVAFFDPDWLRNASAKIRNAPNEMRVFMAPKGCPGRPSWSPRWAPRAGSSDKSASASAKSENYQIYVIFWYRKLWNLLHQAHYPRDSPATPVSALPVNSRCTLCPMADKQ